VEGNEYRAILGATRLLTEHRIDVLFVEYQFWWNKV